jgi:predicted MFS family arabinose efflux permease
MRRIGIRGFLLAIGIGLVGVVIGTLIEQQSAEATVIIFAIGIVLVVLSFLGQRPEKPAEPQ